MKTEHGEYINLIWEYRPDALFVRGHIPPEAAKAKMLEYEDSYTIAEPVEAWGRWSCEHTGDGPRQVFRDYDEPGRGRFPVMRAEVLGWAGCLGHEEENNE